VDISVLGAGAWGTAIAVQAAARHAVRLWGRDAALMERLRATHVNERYLPGVALPGALSLEADLSAALAHARDGLVVIATPMSALREMLVALPAGGRALWLCKGFEAVSGSLGHEIAAQVRPQLSAGVLSGPSFADEVARGQPTALVAASFDASLAEAAVEAFHGDALRIYTSSDPVGVEVGGAVKNVMAIATGIADGLQLGLNARAALVTRGLAEMTRPRAHRDGRPVAQPARRPDAGGGPLAGRHPARPGARGRGGLQRDDRGRACAFARRRDADRAGGGGRAAGAPHAHAGRPAADGPRRTRRALTVSAVPPRYIDPA
jgi:glycerol-3-phosphate dehydrogenase (NAD(P)+)